MLVISSPAASGEAAEIVVEADGEAALNCAGANLKASLYLCAEFDENGAAATNLYFPEVRPNTASDSDLDAACAAIEEHPTVRAALAQMRRQLIDLAMGSAKAELNRLESIAAADTPA